MDLEIEVIGCRVSKDGRVIAGLKISNGEKEKILMYRVGLTSDGRGNDFYIFQVADVLSPNQIYDWRKIDSSRDFGITPCIFRRVLEDYLRQ